MKYTFITSLVLAIVLIVIYGLFVPSKNEGITDEASTSTPAATQPEQTSQFSDLGK